MRSRIEQLLIRAHKALEKQEAEEAWPAVAEALNCNMDSAEALYLAGIIMRRKGHSGLAANLFRRAVSMNPKPISAWMYFGACLHDIHAYDAAMDVWNYVDSVVPRDAGVWRNIAATLCQTAKYGEALNAVQKCIDCAKGDPPANIYAIRALAHLALEHWREGFRDYKYMYGDTIVVREYGQPVAPTWNGEAGKIVIVQGDQGLGDEIMYASILGDAIKDCRKVIYDCHPKMEMAFRRAFPEADIHGTRKQKAVGWIDDLKEQWDDVRSIHISGLGRFYRAKNKDFPRVPYLRPATSQRERWRKRLEGLPRPLVGLTWVGGSVPTMREFRSIQLDQWRPLIAKGGTFIDLSYHDSTLEVEEFNRYRPDQQVLRLDVNQDDYDDTLALLAELDLVVSVTTTVLHACGAIGKRCLVLVNKWVEWRCGINRDDMQFYPRGCVKLFRQRESDEDFSYAIAEIVKEYDEHCKREGIHRTRPSAATSLQRPAELHYPQGLSSGPNYAAGVAAAADHAQGSH